MTERLTEETRRELQGALESQHAELREQIRQELLASDNQHYIDLADLVHDPGDASVADLLMDLEYAELDRHVQSIRAVEAAQQRMARGTYGKCIDCGREIDPARLRANPAAARCIHCQARFEERTASAHPPRL